MSGRRTSVLDTREILRRVQLGESDRATPAPAADHRCGAGVAGALRISRKTVKKYREWAEQEGLLAGNLPATHELQAHLQSALPEPPPLTASTVEPFRPLVIQWRQRGLEAQAIWQRLQADHEFEGSYAAVWRFIRHLEPRTPEATVRIEVKPGEEAQVDFGYVGQMLDPATGEKRKCWVFVMTLSWSRHQYVEFVFDQKVETWLRLHVNAFAHFGALPRRIVLDNLKAGTPAPAAAPTGACAGVVKASLEDPVVQRSYRELAEHYGFLVAPCRPRTPEHKGKVESGVHYVQRNLLGSKDFADIHAANAGALDWIEHRAGQRIHGTTREKPLVRFQEVEQAAMLPLPDQAYDLAVWKQVQVGRDCYVNFEKAYYSAPYTLCGQLIWVRGGLTSIGIYADHELRALHPRAKQPGERQTILSHLPPDKVAGLTITRESCAVRAAEIGPSTAEVVTRLLAERPLDRLPMVKRLLRLADSYSALRLERACTRALHFDDYRAGTIRRILEGGLDLAALPPLAVALEGDLQFARSVDELLPGLGGLSWN